MKTQAPDSSRALTRILLFMVFLFCVAGIVSKVSAQNGELEIFIEWPNEGETLYAGPGSLLHKVPVKGRVVARGYPMAELKVELELISSGKLTGKMIDEPAEDGSFEFYVTVNPHGPTQHFEIAFAECGYECHSSGLLNLLPGEITLVANVSAPNGDSAEVSRRIWVDISDEAIVPVQLLVEKELGQNVSGISVSASTRVYLWRARFFSGTSDENGVASVGVEALDQAPTEYVFSVHRQIVDGVLYEGSESQTVVLPPGAEVAPMISIPVTGRGGFIAGSLLAENANQHEGKPIWAIRAHTGESLLSTLEEDGTFTFENIPLDNYILTLDMSTVLLDGFVSEKQNVNLLENPDGEVQIPIVDVPSEIIDGIVTAEDGTVLPFAWISVEEEDLHSRNLPTDGCYALSLQSDNSVTLVGHAPGYYGQAQKLDPLADQGRAVDFVLTQQEDTEVLNWGSGEVVIPAESDVRRDDFSMTLRRGWLWGNIEGEPLRVNVAGKELLLSDASFSLEYLPGQRAWLYVNEGMAQISPIGGSEIAVIESKQMINLLNDGIPIAVPIDPVVIHALHDDGAPAVPVTWEPSLGSRIRDGVSSLGVGAVQMITFVTYFIVSLGVLLVPLIAVYWWLKRRT
jgi:hypothetical protein